MAFVSYIGYAALRFQIADDNCMVRNSLYLCQMMIQIDMIKKYCTCIKINNPFSQIEPLLYRYTIVKVLILFNESIVSRPFSTDFGKIQLFLQLGIFSQII